MVTIMKSFSLRLWPNGEFGIGYVKRFNPEKLEARYEAAATVRYSWILSELQGLSEAVEVYGSLSAALQRLCPGLHEAIMSEILQSENSDLKTEEVGDILGGGRDRALGSSNASNSHRSLPRGSGGLTSYGKRMIRNGCWLLQKRVARGGVGLITCTLPSCPKETQRELVAGWSEILRIFTQWLTRKLKAAGSKFPSIVGVTEIQEKRRQAEGGLPLHLHLVFASKAGRAYIVSKADVQNAWMRACVSVVPSSKLLFWGASTRVEVVKKNVAHYLSKYMSKGSPEALQQAEKEGFKWPSSWWFAVGKMKATIKRLRCYYTDERADTIWHLAHSNPEVFEYVHKVFLSKDGEEFVIGMSGKMGKSLIDWVKGCG